MTSSRQTWTADELMQVEFPPTRWAVDGILAEGLNLLVGAPKFGKSWLALGLGVAIASGGRAFGRVPVARGDVLYCALEDTGRRLQDRLRKVLCDGSAPGLLVLTTRWDGVDAIERWLAEHPQARLVVVDVLSKIREPALRGESSYLADYKALEPLADLARRYSVCILVVHHTRKATGDDFIDEVSGTHGLAGCADAILVARRSRNTGAAIVKVTGRDVEERELALDFDANTGTWSWLDGPAVLHEVADTRRSILEALHGQQAKAPKQVAEMTGLDHELVKKTLQRMAEDNQVQPAGGGTYLLSLPSLLSPNGDTGDAGDSPREETW